jgi:hypothetical protein
MRQGGAPELIVGASDDLKQWRWILAGARVSGLRAELREGEKLAFLGFPTAAIHLL